MNESCFVCNEPAQRVCSHEKCDQNPFLCGGDCLNNQNQAVITHTHDGKNKFIAYQKVLTKVNCIVNSVGFTEHLNQIGKRIEILIGDLHSMMRRYQEELIKRELKLKNRVSLDINSFISNQKPIKMTGKNVSDIMTATDYHDKETLEQKAIETIQKQMNQILCKLQNMKLTEFLNFQEAKARMKEGKSLATQYKLTECLQQFQKAIRMNPFQQKYKKKVQQCKGWMKSQQQYFATTVLPQQCFDEGTYLFQNQRYFEAIQKFSEAISHNNSNPYYYNSRGLAYFQGSLFKQGIADFTTAIKLDSNIGEFYINRGDCLRCSDQYKEALADYTKSIKLNKDNPDAYNLRGVCYANLKEFPKAIEDYSLAIQLQPTIHYYYLNRAAAYRQLEQHQNELNDYSVLLDQLHIDDPNCYYTRSIMLRERYQHGKALNDVRKAIKISPKPQYLQLQSAILKEIEAMIVHRQQYPEMYEVSAEGRMNQQ